MIKDITTTAAGDFTEYSDTVLVQDDVQCYRVVLDYSDDLTGCNFKVAAKRADDVVVEDIGTVSGRQAYYTLKNNMYSVVGELCLRLTLIGADGSVLTTKELICNVAEASGEGDIAADDRVPALSAMIAEASSAAGAANSAADSANAAAERAESASDVIDAYGYDKFTVTENDYDFTTSKRNVVITCTEEDAQYRSFFLNGTEQGQIITVYNPMWGAEGGVRKDVYLNCFRGTGSNMVTIAVGEQHTFQYAGGNLWDLEHTAAEYLNYGIDQTSCTRVSRPIKRYYVEVPSGNTSTKNISITGLNIEKEKRYHIRFFAKMCDTDLSFKSINAGLLYDTTPSKISVFGWKEVNGVYTEDSDGQAVLGTDRDHFLGEFDLQYVNVSELDGVALLSCSGSSMDSASFTKKTGCIKSAMCNAFNRFTIATSANHLGEGSFIEITTV